MNSSEKTISAIIPFFNEIDTLGEVVERTAKYVDKIILVDDGSTDGSGKLFETNKTITLLRHPENLGKGAALRTGMRSAIEINSDYTVTLDADLQHPPEFIPEFVKAMSGDCDCIIGNRLHNTKSMPFQRILSNKITSYLLSKKLKSEIIDSQNGFRIFKTEILKNILPFENGFEAESEIIIKAGKSNFKIKFLDISVIYNNSDSKMRPLEAIFGFLKVYFKY